MSTDKIREEFEMAYAAEQKEVYTAHGEDYFDSKECFLMHEDGYYLYDNTQSAWWGWTASRATIEVGLPADIKTMAGPVMYAEDVRESIRGAGLKVKP